uniref:Ig-like domain-containing protein n=1 Tax=Gopherus agassizii TaxID=38772 RepID=A0A452GW12_9SAUR
TLLGTSMIVFGVQLCVCVFAGGSGGGTESNWGVTLPTGPLAGWSGSRLTIPCSYTYPEGHLVKAVTWSRDKERIVRLTATAGQGYDKAKRAQFLGDLQHDCTLQLSPLALGDGGTYSFEFQTQSQSWRSPRAVCLTVLGNPRLLLQKQPSLAPCSVMCSCSLSCPETGKSKSSLSMRIIWQHRGAVLECRLISHSASSAAPPVVHVVATPGPHRRTGEPLSLTCQLDTSAYGGLGFSWYKDGERLEWAQVELAFTGIQVADGGEYQCEVHNTLGKSTSLPLTITVVCFMDLEEIPMSNKH